MPEKKQYRIIAAQLNFLVGDIDGNLAKIIASCERARDDYSADLIVFPEFSLSGYPPEDLLLRRDFHNQIQKAIKKLTESISGIDVILGYPEITPDGKLYNALLMIVDQKIVNHYRKQLLPNYGVFDEKRYFTPGEDSCVVDYKGLPIGLLICEDLWFPKPARDDIEQGAKLLIVINASPFDIFKLREREKILRARISENQVPIIYTHMVGGQDELVFDGRSLVMNKFGEVTHLAPAFSEKLLIVDLELSSNELKIIPGEITPKLSDDARAYQALVLATHDYVVKNYFTGALIGLSGGIDSALTLTIAVDALGSDNVHAIIMPSRYTAEMSVLDAVQLAKNLNVAYSIISIEPMYEAFLDSMAPEFAGKGTDTTEENIQARCRAIILMAMSNKFRKIVLNTSNKSEIAMGYGTLYGDMAGGFAVLKDVYKTLVYRLVAYRNQLQVVIPQRIIDRAPSAELRYNQTDQDLLPPYPILDEILQRYVEHDMSIQEMEAVGFDLSIIKRVVDLVDVNEYKRRQAPPGVKITSRAFGRDRRYPITSAFKPY